MEYNYRMDLAEEVMLMFDTGSHSAGIVDQLQLLDRLTGLVLSNIQEFDRRQEWAIAHYPSLRSWLRQVGSRSDRDAASITSTARKLTSLPVTQAALTGGVLSRAQVGAICANVSNKNVYLFAAVEAEMVPPLGDLSIEETTLVMQKWASKANELTDPEPEASDEHLYMSQTSDAKWVIDAQLEDETGRLLEAALKACMTEPVEGDPVLTRSQRRVVALTEMCNRILANDRPTERRASDLTVIYKLADFNLTNPFATYADGTVVPVDRLQRMLCDAIITAIGISDDGQPLRMGRALRTASPAQWRALVARDRHCAFPGCYRPPSACDAHHILEYDRDNGPTDIENLALLCRYHHGLIHKKGWTIQLLQDQRLEVTKPNGQTLCNPPPPLTLTG
jgi:Domain of unknown function (DUF222)/HNH endonuclease